jgi:hypothetical protein
MFAFDVDMLSPRHTLPSFTSHVLLFFHPFIGVHSIFVNRVYAA